VFCPDFSSCETSRPPSWESMQCLTAQFLVANYSIVRNHTIGLLLSVSLGGAVTNAVPANAGVIECAAEGALCKDRLAHQISKVRTSVVSGRDGTAWLRISASGWAPHAGYGNPRLVPSKEQPGPHVLQLRFLIDPPETDGAWPMVLTEVQAVSLLPLQQQKRVRVQGFANSAVAPIDPKAPVFPPAWGKPPKLQTKDWRRLPGKYGFGSSTLAHWIERNQQKR
jgi:hypothetical protein